MTKRGYIQTINSIVELQEIVTKMHERGIDSDQITINQSFHDFAQTVDSGDVVIVYSLECIGNMTELMNISIEFAKRGIRLESLTDSWYHISPDLMPMLIGITELSIRMRANSTRMGLIKARASGKKLGRPIGSAKLKEKIVEVEKLRQHSNMSVIKACETVDCNPRSYYRHIKTRQSK